MKTFYLRNFTDNTDFPFFIQYGYHDENLYDHNHADFYELTIVLSGIATHIVNGEKYLIKKGDMFVIGENNGHSYEDPQDFKICNIMYRLNQLQQSNIDITQSAGFHSLFVIEPYLNRDSRFQSRLKLSSSQFEKVNAWISGMIAEYESKPMGWRTSVYADFLKLVVLLSRAYQVTTANSNAPLNIAIPVDYIGKHFTEFISISDLAKMANMSVRHFTRMFHNIYNVSPNNYIIQFRMQYAYTLLKNSNLTISEVAFRSGFNDSTYFTRQFKKITSMTPKQYRKFLNLSDPE